jgi:hypothetical protein
MMVFLLLENFVDQCSVCFTRFQGVFGWASCGINGGLGNGLMNG